MENNILLDKFNQLEKKLHKFVIKYETLKKEHDQVVEENIELKETLKKQEEELENFKNREKISNIVASIATGTNSTVSLKKKLNEYIEEVDKCIAHLQH